jgi:hypothetical protein
MLNNWTVLMNKVWGKMNNWALILDKKTNARASDCSGNPVRGLLPSSVL